MTERAFVRVLAAFSAAAALALGACSGGSGTGTPPLGNSSGVNQESTQSVSNELGAPPVVYITNESASMAPALRLPDVGPAATRLDDGGVAHILRFGQGGTEVPNVQANMTYHGGAIEKGPKQVLDLWGFGTCNSAAFPPTCTNDPNHTTEILGHFLQNVGGSHYFSVLTQYFSTAQGHITNPTNTLLAVVIDNTAAPLHPTTQDVVNAAFRAEQTLIAHHVVARYQQRH